MSVCTHQEKNLLRLRPTTSKVFFIGHIGINHDTVLMRNDKRNIFI